MISRNTELIILGNHFNNKLEEYKFDLEICKKLNKIEMVDKYLLKIQETEKIIKYYTKEFNIKKSPLEEKIIDLIKSYGGEVHE